MRAQCSPVMRVEWLSKQCELAEITLQQPPPGSEVIYHATPLHPVTEGIKDDEVRVGDLAVLVSDVRERAP